MLVINDKDKRFNFRVAAIAIHDNKILLHQYDSRDNFYALPGGRAEMFESTKETIIREMKEELDEDIHVERLVYVCESFFETDKLKVHEHCHYYKIKFKNEADIFTLGSTFERDEIDGSKLYFSWVDLEDLNDLQMYPQFVKDQAHDLPKIITQITDDEIGRADVR